MNIPSKFDLIVWGAIAACVLGLGLVVKRWHDASVELPKVRAQVAQLQDDYAALEQRQADNAKKTETHGHEFDQAQAKLDADRSAARAPVVRMCVPVSETSRIASRGSAQPGDAASADPGFVPEGARRDTEERAGPDIGPDLYALADRADDVALIAQRCQAWIVDNP